MRDRPRAKLCEIIPHLSASIATTAVAILYTFSVIGFVANSGIASLQSWSATLLNGEWTVTSVNGDGPAAKHGLKTGDRVLGINGFDDAVHLGPGLPIAQAQHPHTIRFSRGTRQLEILIPVWKDVKFSILYSSYLLLALVNFSVAIVVLRTRLRDQSALLAFVLFLSASTVLLNVCLRSFPPPVSSGALSFFLLSGSLAWRPLQWAALFDLAVRFPKVETTWPGLWISTRILYCVGLLLSTLLLLPELVLVGQQATHPSLLLNHLTLALLAKSKELSLCLEIFSTIALLSTFGVFGAKYKRIPDKTVRLRLIWIAAGLTAALIPIAIEECVLLISQFTTKAELATRVKEAFDPIAVLFSALVPITFTYAIVKHQIMGIRLTIRHGVQYLLARNVLRAICYLPLIGMAAELFLERQRPLQEIVLGGSWWAYCLLLISLCLTFRFRKPIERWVDRKFFRTAYEEEVILPELVRSIQACDTIDEVATSVASRLEAAFQARGSAFLVGSNGVQWHTLFAHEAPFALSFRSEALVLEHTSFRIRTCLMPYQFDSLNGEPNQTWQILSTPITTPTGGDTDAVLLLGPRKSEEAYSERDIKLVEAVAAQTALVLQVLALKSRAREDALIQANVLSKLNKEAIDLIAECPQCNGCYGSRTQEFCPVDGSTLVLTLPVERVIDGKYRLERRIGAGGMSAVYQATDLRLHRTVALKVLTGRLFGNSQATRRFSREARAVARLQHPHIVPIYDFGSLRGDGAFLVMKLIEGESWRNELARSNSIDPVRIAAWFDQLCAAMITAHSNGIVHRDLKPENLIISKREDDRFEHLTVLDFGLAKGLPAADEIADSLTVDNAVVGTYGYMSPEQRQGTPVDARSDIYSCAVLLAETLSGIRPTMRGASQEWLQRTLRWNEDSSLVTEQLTNLLTRCLAEDPQYRPESMQCLRSELIPLLEICPAIRTRKRMVAAAAVTAAVTLSMPS